MAILVTGGAGYVGSHFLLAGQSRGEIMVVLDDLSTGRPDLLPPGVPLVKGDTGDAELVASVIRRYNIESIIHFAAKTSVPESIAHPLLYYNENTSKARDLVETAIREGVPHFVFSSSAAVYGSCPGGVAEETMLPAPISPYGRSKLITEWILADVAAAHGLRFAALRYFNVAGADPDGRSGQTAPQSTHLIRLAVQAALGKLPGLVVHGVDYPTADGTCVRDYVHVSDLAQMHLATLDYLRRGGASVTMNCGYGHGASVLQVVEMVKRISGANFPVTFGPRRIGDPPSLIASVRRAHALLGLRPQYAELEVIVEHALAWERRLVAQGG